MTLANTTRSRRQALVRLLILIAAAAVLAAPLAGQRDDRSREPVDLQAIFQIKEEGLQRSRVMDIASYLTDVHGPRLTGSPNIRAAAEWAIKEMHAWGLANATLATWGSFGRGWTGALRGRTQWEPPAGDFTTSGVTDRAYNVPQRLIGETMMAGKSPGGGD